MKQLCLTMVLLFFLLLLPSSFVHSQELIHHDLKVRLFPGEQRFSAQDTVTIPVDIQPVFFLHKSLEPSSLTPGVSIIQIAEEHRGVPVVSFSVNRPAGLKIFEIEYGGKIHHPPELYGKEHARGFKQTPGIISEQGVYLAASSYWYPGFGESLMTFTLEISLPANWDAVSQGQRSRHDTTAEGGTVVQWGSTKPHEEIHIIAAPFVEYSRQAGKAIAMVFLRSSDDGLADKYLDVTAQYLAMYGQLIGPYPYEKFALAENFWETGYGMASFSLLGPKIIRFPFILHSSYPHEILHNWWGNCVFPDFKKGNWSEGLTAYLADHLIKEMRGNGLEHRQQTLQKYADYVLEERDFPLTQFRSRHSSSSEAIGYGKSLMVFHMLRRILGDERFSQGLRQFYRQHQFRLASFNDLQKSFEDVFGQRLDTFFDQWTIRSGAPQLQVSGAQVREEGNGYVLTSLIEQVQPESPYLLEVPVAVTTEGADDAFQTVVRMDTKRANLRLPLTGRPLRVDVDPEFDLFRRLDRNETPPALTQALGARSMLILLPSAAPQGLLDAYRGLAQTLAESGPDNVEIQIDDQVKKIPEDRSVVLLGWENVFRREAIAALSQYDIAERGTEIRVGHTTIAKKGHSVVLTARQPKNADVALTWVASDSSEALPGLGRKLPHYHKYSYLGFRGEEPENIAKGRWPVLNSPMTVFLPYKDGTMSQVERGELEPRKPLATLAPVFSKNRMMDTILFLASDQLQGRGFGTEGLDRAADFIAATFQEAGLDPAGDDEKNFFQIWEDRGGKTGKQGIAKNVVGIIKGQTPGSSAQSVVVGAHYDHLGLGWPDVRKEHRGKIHPGADDNASGVAVLLELARILGKSLKPDRTVVFVAFAGEEADRKGSKYYVANQRRDPAQQCIGMLNIDTVGRLGKGKLLVLGDSSAKEWGHIFRGAGFVTGVDVQTVSEELDTSDQFSFQEAGIPAVQLFSGPHLDYHRPTDTANKIDDEGLVKVASVAKEVIEHLASQEATLTPPGAPGSSPNPVAGHGKRKVSLGTIPDFAFTGDGCRLSGVVPDSPAQQCGLQEGDVIIQIGTRDVNSLKGLSEALKSLDPGDKVSIKFLRQNKQMSVEAQVVDR